MFSSGACLRFCISNSRRCTCTLEIFLNSSFYSLKPTILSLYYTHAHTHITYTNPPTRTYCLYVAVSSSPYVSCVFLVVCYLLRYTFTCWPPFLAATIQSQGGEEEFPSIPLGGAQGRECQGGRRKVSLLPQRWYACVLCGWMDVRTCACVPVPQKCAHV
jgi:hypothetical protein